MTLANLVAALLDVIERKINVSINVSIVILAIIRIIIATSTDTYYRKKNILPITN